MRWQPWPRPCRSPLRQSSAFATKLVTISCEVPERTTAAPRDKKGCVWDSGRGLRPRSSWRRGWSPLLPSDGSRMSYKLHQIWVLSSCCAFIWLLKLVIGALCSRAMSQPTAARKAEVRSCLVCRNLKVNVFRKLGLCWFSASLCRS